MCREYSNISSYLVDITTLQARIAAIEAIIDNSLLLLADTATNGGNYSYYEMDDGQIRVKTGYRSLQDVSAGIDALEKIKTRYINQMNGRAVVLQDKSTFRGY